MPAVPIFAAIASVPAAIGAAAATAVGLGTVGTVAATAIGTGIISGGITAVQGGDVGDVLKSAVIGGATSFVGGTVAGAVGGVVAEATGSTVLGKALGSAAGTLATGGSSEDILRSGLISGTISGLSSAEDIFNQSQFEQSMTESGLAGQALMDDVDQLLADIQPTGSLDIPGTTSKLDLFGAARGLAPSVITALLQKSAYENAVTNDDGQTSYSVVPVPTDWRSPDYTQQQVPFTPLEPVDFGSADLLQGTQWNQTAKPMQIDGLMNVLNNQYIQPQAAPEFGLNQIVGNVNDVPMSINDIINNIGNYQPQPFDMGQNIGQLNGSPASLASIIAGIQGQYGQEATS
jgi:hypothetical protein